MEPSPLYTVRLPEFAVKTMLHWANEFATLWRSDDSDTPNRIHQRSLAPDGSPQWHPEFAAWISADESKKSPSEQKRRTKRAFRQLRRVAPREYEVAYRFCVKSESLAQISDWLNDRAIRNGKTERYDRSAVLLILYSAIDKVMDYF